LLNSDEIIAADCGALEQASRQYTGPMLCRARPRVTGNQSCGQVAAVTSWFRSQAGSGVNMAMYYSQTAYPGKFGLPGVSAEGARPRRDHVQLAPPYGMSRAVLMGSKTA
jgi:hypothetical protein